MTSAEERIPGKNPIDHIEALITYLPTEHGGKKTPINRYGYRPQFYYNGQDWDAQHNYPDVEQVMPGSTARGLLCFAAPEKHAGILYVGKPFLIREGQHVVAYGVVTKILELPEIIAEKDMSGLSDDELDALLMAQVKKSQRKVALVIGMAMSGYENWDEERVGRRIIALVESGKVEAFGDVRKWRFSEIRLPAK